MVNTNKIKGRLRELGLTQFDVAKSLKISQSTANQKINNTRCFTLEEANDLAKLMDIMPCDFGEYFFTH